MKLKFYAAGLLLALCLNAQGALYYSDATTGTIWDNSTIGLTRTTSFSGEAFQITGATLTFTLQGGLLTDLQGYLRLGNQTSSPYYSLNTWLQSQTSSIIPNTPTTYSVNVGSAFQDLNPNNTWTLFFADTSPGGQTSFGGWSLDITAVPEPTNVALGVFGGIGGVVGLVRFIRNRRAAQA